QIAGALSLACLDRISPVGVLGAGDDGLHVPPTLSKDRVMQWLHQLRQYREDRRTRLAQRLADLGTSLTGRAMLIVLSDMHEPDALPIIKRLSGRHDCCVLQLRDPAEQSLSGTGFFRGVEAETGRAFVAHGRTSFVDNEQVRTQLRRAGIDHLVLQTDGTIAMPLRQFFAARGLLGKGAR
ncbi:MAG: DUF58 domain-containing protein, partial [Planctomycetota bacterium]